MISSEPEPGSEAAVDRTKNQKGVLCGQCDFLNYLGHNDCERCGRPLYLNCRRCGRRNQRTLTRCHHCRSRLYRGRLFSSRGRRHRRTLLRSILVRSLQVCAVLLGLAAIGGIIYLIGQL
jgi:predicted amidophosphoribosyltransferase